MKRKLFTLVLTFFCLTTFGQFSSYKFSGNAKDSIGSYHGSVKGATLTKDRFGMDSSAYSFNSGNKDYIAVYPSPNIGGKPFGVSVWFNAQSNKGAQVKIIDWYACGFSTCLGDGIYTIGLKNDKLHFQIRSNGKALAFDTIFVTSDTYDDGIWHHTALTFDSTSGNIAIYIDNQVFQSFNRPFGNMSPVPNTLSVPMSIGRRDESRVGKSWDYFNGKIDDILVYNEFLSASKIDSLFNVGYINRCPNTYTLSNDTTYGCSDTVSLTLSGSDTLFDYYLLDTVRKTYAEGPIKGTGDSLTFKALNASKYKVVTESNISNSLKFDGSNDYVAIDNTTGFPMGNAARTMECWMKTTSSGSWDVMVDYGNPGKSNNRSSLMMNGYTGALAFAGENNDLDGTTKINDGKWHHTAVTHDGVTLKLYVDGKLDASKKLTLATAGNNFKIGQRSDLKKAEHFNGEITKVRIWDASFNVGTIQQLMTSCVTGKEMNLVAAYNFTSDSSATLLDATTGVKNGTLTNMDTIKAWQIAPPFEVSNTVTVIQNKLPNPDLGKDISMCTYDSINLTPGTFTSYLWGDSSTSNSLTVIGDTTGAGSFTYFVEVTDSNGCKNIDTIGLKVNPIPAITSSNTDTICSGTATTISLKASLASTFSWTFGSVKGAVTGASSDTGSTINQTLTNPSNSIYGGVVYTVIPTSIVGSCVGSSSPIKVIVNPKPALTNSNTASICSGTATNIALTASTASTFSWTIGFISGNVTGTSSDTGSTLNQTLTNQSNSAYGGVIYDIIPTSITGSCVGSSSSIKVAVNPKPDLTNSNADTICSGTATNIALTASVASTFSWSIGAISGNVTGTSSDSGSTLNQTLTNQSNSAYGGVIYDIIPTSITGSCVGSSSSIKVAVNPKPDLTNSNADTICSGTATDISLTASVPSTFSWTFGSVKESVTGASNDTGSTINQTLTNPSDSIFGGVVYTIIPTSITGACIGNPRPIKVIVNPIPNPTVSGVDQICENETAMYSTLLNSGRNYEWKVIGGAISSGQNTNNITVIWDVSGQGSVQVRDSISTTGCVNSSAAFSVELNPNPNPAFTFIQDSSINGRIQLNTASGAGLTYQWFFGDGTSDTSRNPEHTYTSNDNYSIKLIVISAFGCIDSSTQFFNLTNVGVSEIKENNFGVKVYPNPFSHQLSLSYTITKTTKVELKIYTTDGKLIYSEGTSTKTPGEYNLNLHEATMDLNEGIYQLSIRFDDRIIHKPLMKLN